jgi:hypothetical protein
MYWTTLLLLPLIFSHWLGIIFTGFYLFYLFSISLISRFIRKDWKFTQLAFMALSIIFFFVFINFEKLLFSPTSLNLSYAIQYLSLFGIIFIASSQKNFDRFNFNNIASFFFWICFLTIFLEFVLVNFLGISKSVFPAARLDSPVYMANIFGFHRPFGLTGQASVNGCLLILSYLLVHEFNIHRLYHSLLALIGIIMTISGQAILVGIITIFLLNTDKLNASIPIKLFLLSIASALLFIFLKTDFFFKISWDYLMRFIFEWSNIENVLFILTPSQWFLGTLGDIFIQAGKTSEFYLITSIFLWGLFFTSIFWIFNWLLLSKSRYAKTWFVVIFISSLHYPTIFFIEAQIIIALVYFAHQKKSSI